MDTTISEESPLIVSSEENNYESASFNVLNEKNEGVVKGIIKGIIKGIENFLDFVPFIIVQSLIGSQSPTFALGAGALSAALVFFYSFLKHCFRTGTNVGTIQLILGFQPKTMDVGSFMLFGTLYVTAQLLQSLSNNDAIGMYLLLWFNPITTGGLALIMYYSILRGRPFVYDYAQDTIPAGVWERLISRVWFQDILTKAAIFWVKILTAMTVIVTIQPLLVTLLYQGDVNMDTSGLMITIGNWLAGGQFLILFYGFYVNARMQGRGRRNTKRARNMKQNGLTEKERCIYGDSLDLKISHSSHRIVSLSQEEDLMNAAIVLAGAFRTDEMLQSFLQTEEVKLSFFHANLKSVSYFHQVLACLDDDMDEKQDKKDDKENKKDVVVCKPMCVMSCIPVLSKSQEELEVFNSYEAWLEHGFFIPEASETNFLLPDDELFEMGQMKKRKVHGLSKRQYIYIAFFGADLDHQGKGYGRTLLNYIISLSEQKQLPLVLETGTVWNRTQYEKYGFEVIDHVKDRPDIVLMVRWVGQPKQSDV